MRADHTRVNATAFSAAYEQHAAVLDEQQRALELKLASSFEDAQSRISPLDDQIAHRVRQSQDNRTQIEIDIDASYRAQANTLRELEYSFAEQPTLVDDKLEHEVNESVQSALSLTGHYERPLCRAPLTGPSGSLNEAPWFYRFYASGAQKEFYFCPVTKQRLWSRPSEVTIVEDVVASVWFEYFDESVQRAYYYQPVTDETVAERPRGQSIVIAKHQYFYGGQRNGRVFFWNPITREAVRASEPPSGGRDISLSPHVWYRLRSPERFEEARALYYNVLTAQTTWRLPIPDTSKGYVVIDCDSANWWFEYSVDVVGSELRFYNPSLREHRPRVPSNATVVAAPEASSVAAAEYLDAIAASPYGSGKKLHYYAFRVTGGGADRVAFHCNKLAASTWDGPPLNAVVVPLVEEESTWFEYLDMGRHEFYYHNPSKLLWSANAPDGASVVSQDNVRTAPLSTSALEQEYEAMLRRRAQEQDALELSMWGEVSQNTSAVGSENALLAAELQRSYEADVNSRRAVEAEMDAFVRSNLDEAGVVVEPTMSGDGGYDTNALLELLEADVDASVRARVGEMAQPPAVKVNRRPVQAPAASVGLLVRAEKAVTPL